MRPGIRVIAAALCFAGLAAPSAMALDGCPRGEFTLDSCVLCLPGYSPQPTGNKNPQGKACYACKKDPAVSDPQEYGPFERAPICPQDADPVSLAAALKL